jgi:methyltransferase-like protein
MPRKSAKQIVNEVISKVDKKIDTPRLSNKSKPAPKKEEIKEAVEHLRQCMVNVVRGSNCNCSASRK